MIFKISAIIFSFVLASWWNDKRHIGCHRHLVLAQEQDHGMKGIRGGHPNHGSDDVGFSLVSGDPTDAVAEAASAYTASVADVVPSVIATDLATPFNLDFFLVVDPFSDAKGDSDGAAVGTGAGADDEGVASSNNGATTGGSMDIDLVGGNRFVPVDLSSSLAVGDGKILEHSIVSSIDDMFVEADIDRLLKNNKAGKVAKNMKGGKKGKSEKEVDFPNPSDEEVNEQQCTIALFRGSYRYTSPCGKGILATIACGEDDDGGLGDDTCRYSERVVAQNVCPESGLLIDEEEEDPCSVGGLFKQSENIGYNADTNSCELAYFDFSEDRCELYLEEGGLGMKAVIRLSARQEMLLRFSYDSGETFYNEEAPRIAMVSPNIALYDTDRALSSDLIHAAKQRRLSCQACGLCFNIYGDELCEIWKNLNYCEESSDSHLFMLDHCHLTCTPECTLIDCFNNYQVCEFWKYFNYCEESSVYHWFMSENCPLACGLC